MQHDDDSKRQPPQNATQAVEQEQEWLQSINILMNSLGEKIDREQKKQGYPHDINGQPALTTTSQCYDNFIQWSKDQLRGLYTAEDGHEFLRKASSHIQNVWSDVNGFLQLTRTILEKPMPLDLQQRITTQMVWFNEAIKHNNLDKMKHLFLSTLSILEEATQHPELYERGERKKDERSVKFFAPSKNWTGYLTEFVASFDKVKADLLHSETTPKFERKT